MLIFPRYVFSSKTSQIVESQEDYDKALDMGWFGTIPEALALPVAPVVPPAPPEDAPKPPAPPSDPEGPPTREELEAKAAEMGLVYDRRIGDKRLAALIESKLEG